ncbi:MAG TPA: hypothetical protein VLL76_05135 [Candidatus Omnitrophota bacterium]|nr:hypothetical protein [Candidatus Omnitrophota bacterium]
MIQNACKPAAAPSEARGASSAFAMGLRMNRSADFLGNAEPGLDEMMADEVIRRVMARDGVAADQLLSMLDRVRHNLGST